MSLRITLLLFAFALLIAGSWLVHQSTAMPEWTDEQKALAVQNWNPPLEDSGPAVAAYNKHWVRAINALRSEKWPYHDAGAALIVFALCLTAALFVLRINTMADVALLMTPKRPWTIYALGLGGWFLYWTSAILALSSVVLAAAAFFILRKSNLPAPLWIWRKDMPGHDWFYTIGTGAAVLIGAEVLRQTYCYGHWLAVPSVFLCVYATLAARAAGIAKMV
jgi:hypothetical protein